MNKKIVFTSLGVGVVIIGASVWYFGQNKNSKPNAQRPTISFQSDDPSNEKNSSGEEVPSPPKKGSESSATGRSDKSDFTPASIDLGGKDRPLSEEEMDQLEAYYERTEKEWDQTVANLFNEFGLPKETFGEYEKLREAYEEAKMDAFQEFHNKMIEKYGENYEYNPSDEQENFDEKVNAKYQEKLKQLIKPQNYPKYIEVRDQRNEKLSKEQNPELGKMLMDF